jgi:REP element-mobilizing transposase RayT
MTVRVDIRQNSGLFFITFTCYEWISLFEIVDGYDIVYRWFDHLKSKGHYICGYVIMPNHIHAIIGFRKTSQALHTIIGNGKRFIAYEIVRRLQRHGNSKILRQLEQGVNNTDRSRGKLHQVFEPSFEIKECVYPKFITQKLEYIHKNPCSGKWNLASSPSGYKHSSALFYLEGKHSTYEVTNIGTMQDVNLHSNASL